jgi:hypothetical protein
LEADFYAGCPVVAGVVPVFGVFVGAEGVWEFGGLDLVGDWVCHAFP